MITNLKKKVNRRLKSKNIIFLLLFIFLFFFFLFLVHLNFKIFQKRKEVISQFNYSRQQKEDLKNTIKNLQKKIENSDNIDYLEKIAYEELGEVKAGEKSIIFIMPQQENLSFQDNSQNNNSFLSNIWESIKNFLRWIRLGDKK